MIEPSVGGCYHLELGTALLTAMIKPSVGCYGIIELGTSLLTAMIKPSVGCDRIIELGTALLIFGQSTDYRSPITSYRSPLTDHRSPITPYRSRSSKPDFPHQKLLHINLPILPLHPKPHIFFSIDLQLVSFSDDSDNG